MTPEQEAMIHREFQKLHGNGELIRGDVRGLREELATVRSEMRRGQAETNTRLSALEERVDKHGRRVRSIEQKIAHQPDERDVTGSFPALDVALLQARQAQLDEAERVRRSESLWGKRQLKVWMVGALGALGMALLSGAGAVIFWALTHR